MICKWIYDAKFSNDNWERQLGGKYLRLFKMINRHKLEYNLY